MDNIHVARNRRGYCMVQSILDLVKIFDYDHPLRKLVQSESDADVSYLVDLSDPEFPAGRCACEDYSIRIEPFVKRGEEPECGRLQCKHLKAVTTKLLGELKRKLIPRRSRS